MDLGAQLSNITNVTALIQCQVVTQSGGQIIIQLLANVFASIPLIIVVYDIYSTMTTSALVCFIEKHIQMCFGVALTLNINGKELAFYSLEMFW